MKLSLKLPLAFAISLALLFLGGMFGIYHLNRAVEIYEVDVARRPVEQSGRDCRNSLFLRHSRVEKRSFARQGSSET